MVKFKSKNLIEIYIKNNLCFCFYIKGHPERAGIGSYRVGWGCGVWKVEIGKAKNNKVMMKESH